jgi:phosphoenolpyruvate-protein phosphotransferase (PTS system enzyme I)
MHSPIITPAILEGKAGTGGVVSGIALVLGEDLPSSASNHVHCDDPQAELIRFNQSKEKASKELSALLITAQRLGGSDVRNIIHTQLEILNDPELNSELHRTISNEFKTAEHAIEHVFRHYISRIEETGSAYMMERTADLRDLRDRIYRHLHFVSSPADFGGNILIANEISPTELLEYAPYIQGAATAKGGATSHVTIIASSMNIPFVAGVKDLTKYVITGDPILIDADNHALYLKPNAKLIAKIRKNASHHEMAGKLTEVDTQPASTSCGKSILVRANVEFESELDQLETFKPQGIGLVRTESMLMAIGASASMMSQLDYYRAMAAGSGPHGVTFRLLDIGGDKLTERDSGESNPHLGWRGARLLLDRPLILESQLDAILQVSAEYPGRVRLMLPMVSVLDEWLAFRKILDARMEHFERHNWPFDTNIRIGMMIEVPSAAISAHSLAQHADFLSIGTNDLTQYVLAVDRGNPLVSDLYESIHPAVLRAIRWIVDAGSAAGIPVSVCGEMASQPVAAACLIGMGVTELSMSFRAIPTIRRMIRRYNMRDFEEFLSKMMAANTRNDRESLSEKWLLELGSKNK